MRRNGTRRNEALLEIDSEQAHLVRQAFELYATGEWATNALHAEMTRRGLRTHKGTPVPKSYFTSFLLRNKLYAGTMVWKGVEFPGKHEPIVTKELYDQVQRVFIEHDFAGTRTRRHFHYLRGTLFCGECGSRFSSSYEKGNGGTYLYYYCLGRHRRRTDCREPYARAEKIEGEIEKLYEKTRFTEEGKRVIRETLEREIRTRMKDTLKTAKQMERG